MSSGTLWTTLGLLVVGIGAGVQLGDAAVGDIDPVHFRGAAVRPQAVTPPAPVPPSPYQQAVSWDQGLAARRAETGYEDLAFGPPPLEPREAAAEPQWQELETVPTLTPWPPGQLGPRREIERYTDFPIEQPKVAPETPSETPPAAALSLDAEKAE